MNDVGSVQSTVPVTNSYQYTIQRVYKGPEEGTVKIVNDVYSITMYDIGGTVQTITNKHTIDFVA